MKKAILVIGSAIISGCSTLGFEEVREVEEIGCSSDQSICIEVTRGKEEIQNDLENLIIRHEGYRRHPYPDRGVLSIGHGRNLTTNGISESEARYLLRNDIDRITKALSERFPVFDELTNNRRAVLISMAYGLGIEGISKFQYMWENLEKRDYVRAALEIYLSNYCGQVGNRCRDLAEMMEKDELPE